MHVLWWFIWNLNWGLREGLAKERKKRKKKLCCKKGFNKQLFDTYPFAFMFLTLFTLSNLKFLHPFPLSPLPFFYLLLQLANVWISPLTSTHCLFNLSSPSYFLAGFLHFFGLFHSISSQYQYTALHYFTLLFFQGPSTFQTPSSKFLHFYPTLFPTHVAILYLYLFSSFDSSIFCEFSQQVHLHKLVSMEEVAGFVWAFESLVWR